MGRKEWIEIEGRKGDKGEEEERERERDVQTDCSINLFPFLASIAAFTTSHEASNSHLL